ncbi:MAG: heme-copper oxidase subunit III [Phycisphaeraceae bacterium]|nr:heme-copper oxidase subunit III [Phycisphaeraceae bacterium]
MSHAPSSPIPHTPPSAGRLAMLLFLASLTMLFLASIAAYAVIRLTGSLSPPVGSVSLPGLLWVSTVIMLISSVTMHHALKCVSFERITHFKISMTATFGLALLFVALQGPALAGLLAEHNTLRHGGEGVQPVHLYGMVFLMILLHAAHVVGGLIPMLVVLINALADRYDHEQHRPVTHLAMYWHFLDIVWLVMFVTFLALS